MRKASRTEQARAATQHWWRQRLTALCLLPLTVWFILGLAQLPQLTYGGFLDWIRTPLNAITLGIFMLLGLFHAVMGLEVIIEDYVHHPALKVGALKTIRFVLVLAEAAAVVSILKLSLPDAS